MKLLAHKTWLVQQAQSDDQLQKLIAYLRRTGKLITDIPSDSFIWTGSPEQLHGLLKEFEK